MPAVHFSAEKFWNARTDRYNYNAWIEVLRQYDARSGSVPQKQVTYPLDSVANLNLERVNVFKIEKWDIPFFSSIPHGEWSSSGIHFALPAKNAPKHCVAAAGIDHITGELPGKVTKAINQKAATLVFLHTALTGKKTNPGSPIGVGYEVRYTDGSVAAIPLQLDENICAFSPPVKRLRSDNSKLWAAYLGNSSGEYPAALYAFEWDNPQKEKTIESISLISTSGAKSTVLWFALSAYL